jgi:hypothetical protein
LKHLVDELSPPWVERGEIRGKTREMRFSIIFPLEKWLELYEKTFRAVNETPNTRTSVSHLLTLGNLHLESDIANIASVGIGCSLSIPTLFPAELWNVSLQVASHNPLVLIDCLVFLFSQFSDDIRWMKTDDIVSIYSSVSIYISQAIFFYDPLTLFNFPDFPVLLALNSPSLLFLSCFFYFVIFSLHATLQRRNFDFPLLV